MGNRASVSPNEPDHERKGNQTKAKQRRKEGHNPKTPDARDSAPNAPRPRRSDNSASSATKAAQVVAQAPADIARISEVGANSQKSKAAPTTAAHSEEHPPQASSGFAPNADGGSNLSRDRDGAKLVERRKSEKNDMAQDLPRPVDKHQPEKQEARGSREHTVAHGGSREETASEENTSGSSGGDSYTSSSYSSGSDESDDDDASDDTFFDPKERKPLGGGHGDGGVGGDSGGGVVVRVIVDGDREEADQVPILGGRTGEQEQKEREKSERRAGKSKRRRPANRHYIKDETMRTLFGLLPFYGGDGGPMDQMVKTTLTSVGPSTIDVRNEAGDTLLILACQHACEDLVEPILAKGANPTAVNAVGICPLHYTCFADSLSFDAAEALLWRGADTSTAETTYGCTPLHYAASAGDAEICALLVEHGAQPQTQDYYTYTAVKYAKDAGHETIVELLGGEEEGEGCVEMDEVYMGTDEGENGDDSGPTGGLWLRHIDPQTELAYYMNDETGESWWETDLLAVAKGFLATVPASDGGPSRINTEATSAAITLPPLGVREWLVQEQVRSWLVAIFSRADPLRLMEVDLVLQIGKADFKEMVKALMIRYGILEFEFLRKASSPKLEPLGISSLIPSKDDLGTAKKEPSASSTTNHPAGDSGSAQSQPSQVADGNKKNGENLSPAITTSGGQNGSSSMGGAAALGQQEWRDNNSSSVNINTNRTTLQRGASSQHSMKRTDSPAALRADADKIFQEAVSRQEKDLAEERKRQTNILDEQRNTIRSLEEMMEKRAFALAKTREEAEEASAVVAKLQSALADDDSGQAASDSLSEEIARLKASIAAERVRISHITEALEATKGSAEERAEKQQVQEEDRRVRLERLKSENAEEVEKLRTDAADSLRKTKEAWEAERVEMEGDLIKKVEQETALLQETVENAANVLSEAAATSTRATDAARQGAGKVEEARTWMKANVEAHANSRQIDVTNKQLHTSLRREMERAKQLHNQIEDMKGQTRMYARVRPMDALEKEAGCKEVCLRDGKQTLALLTAARQHWTYTQVFQNPSADSGGTTAGQAELHKEVAGLGTTLADGHNVLLLAAGASRSGKTLTLVGEPDETTRPAAAGPTAPGNSCFFLAEVSGEGGGGTSATAPLAAEGKKVPKKGKGKAGGGAGGGERGAAESLHDGGGGVAAKATALAGIFPRLLAEAFATLNHRAAQCAYVVWVSAAAVSIPAPPDAASSRGAVVESLLPPSAPPPPACGGHSSTGSGGQTEDEVGAALNREEQKEERDPELPPRAPPEDDGRWGSAVAASSPQEVMEIITGARSRAKMSEGAAAETREDRHFLSRIRVELVNRSTHEVSSCEMVIVELAEEKPGEAWPAALAESVRAHAAATSVTSNKLDEATGLLGMVRACLTDTAKVVTLLCVSPADSHADKTERVLGFGKACENSGEDGAAQLRDLKKELARLKKETKGTKRTAPSQLPRPAGGKRA